MKSKLAREIESLKTALDYKDYKKEHPGTKKKPNDPMFNHTDLANARFDRHWQDKGYKQEKGEKNKHDQLTKSLGTYKDRGDYKNDLRDDNDHMDAIKHLNEAAYEIGKNPSAKISDGEWGPAGFVGKHHHMDTSHYPHGHGDPSLHSNMELLDLMHKPPRGSAGIAKKVKKMEDPRIHVNLDSKGRPEYRFPHEVTKDKDLQKYYTGLLKKHMKNHEKKNTGPGHTFKRKEDDGE